MQRFRYSGPLVSIILILALLSLPIIGLSFVDLDNAVWANTFGGSHYDEGISIVETPEGNFVMSGRTKGFEALPQDDEIWLVSCDENGNYLWNKTYSGGMKYGGYMSTHHHSVTVINSLDEGFLLTSHTTNFGSGDVNGWLTHTDTVGNHLWNYTYGGPQDEILIESVMSSEGGYLSAGFTENISAGVIDAWVLRTDVNGNHLWNRTYGTEDVGEIFYDVIEVSGGGYLMAGHLGESDHFEDRSSTFVDVWLVRIDADGNHLWNQTYGGISVEAPNQVIQCSNGDFAFCGGTLSYGAGEFDAWVVRTSSNGQILWNHTYGGNDIESAFGLTECEDGGFGIFTLTYTNALGESDAWFVRTDSEGNQLWNQKYVGAAFDQFWGGIATDDGFVAVGITQSFGAGNVDMWIVKIADVSPTSPNDTSSSPTDVVVFVIAVTGIVVVLLVVIVLMKRRT
ncbi:MAG: hypothetical protein ACW98Y_04955 [Candidatus Thorarchaeota archaeon]